MSLLQPFKTEFRSPLFSSTIITIQSDQNGQKFSRRSNMPYRIWLIPMLSILVLLLLLSLFLLMRPTSTTNTSFIGKKVIKEIRRNLIDVKPPSNHAHDGSGH
ncbi:hypothetical protein ES288_D05G292700v1 [Gossypium darwinii]|uniref:Transmembrane protein n=2 Tax=Gossypium TaxID=3633 RepID=A0A5D2CLA3_GOSDA|nr:hypothetical protein ES288_D05G292700v1 [Gossypium darwinii]